MKGQIENGSNWGFFLSEDLSPKEKEQVLTDIAVVTLIGSPMDSEFVDVTVQVSKAVVDRLKWYEENHPGILPPNWTAAVLRGLFDVAVELNFYATAKRYGFKGGEVAPTEVMAEIAKKHGSSAKNE